MQQQLQSSVKATKLWQLLNLLQRCATFLLWGCIVGALEIGVALALKDPNGRVFMQVVFRIALAAGLWWLICQAILAFLAIREYLRINHERTAS